MSEITTEQVEKAQLPPREVKVLRLFFGLNGERKHSLEEIGVSFGVTKERIRQLRDRALGKMRDQGIIE